MQGLEWVVYDHGSAGSVPVVSWFGQTARYPSQERPGHGLISRNSWGICLPEQRQHHGRRG